MPGKTPLYVLHGWSIAPDNQVKWREFLVAMGKLGVQAHFVPMPGLDTELTQSFTIDDYANHLATVLPKNKINLLGHSVGGQLAMHFTAQHPDRVEKLILVDSAGLRLVNWPAQLKRAVFWTLAQIGKRLTSSKRARHWLYALAREKDYLQASPVMRQTMVNLIGHNSRVDASQIVVPTLLIWGEMDRVTPLWIGRELLSLIAGSRLEIIKTARHSPHFTHSSQTARVVADFLA